jgi:uncharacterized protein (DUF433 family)
VNRSAILRDKGGRGVEPNAANDAEWAGICAERAPEARRAGQIIAKGEAQGRPKAWTGEPRFAAPGRGATRSAHRRLLKNDAASDLIDVNPDVPGGTAVFTGTRVPVRTLFEYLEDNYTLEQCLECFPTVSRQMALAVLEESEAALLGRRAG